MTIVIEKAELQRLAEDSDRKARDAQIQCSHSPEAAEWYRGYARALRDLAERPNHGADC